MDIYAGSERRSDARRSCRLLSDQRRGIKPHTQLHNIVPKSTINYRDRSCNTENNPSYNSKPKLIPKSSSTQAANSSFSKAEISSRIFSLTNFSVFAFV